MAQIYLFTGENDYALNAERTKWVSHFLEKHGESNLSMLQGKNLKFREMMDEVAVAPFIAEKRLVIVSGIPPMEKEEVLKIPKIMHEQVILVFIDPKPDKRFSATKELMKMAEIKDFPPLSASQLEQWIVHTVSLHQGSIEPQAVTMLAGMVGGNQQAAFQELQKLLLFAQGKTIGTEHLDAVTMVSGEQQVWHLMDLLGDGKTNEALRYARSLLDRGESAQSIWARFLWMMNNLIQVSAVVQTGERNPANIARKTGVAFPSVRGLLPIASRLSRESLTAMIRSVVETDVQLKTGGYRATVDEPQELEAILDRAILSFRS